MSQHHRTSSFESQALRILNLLEHQMSKLTDAVAALSASVDAAVNRDQALVAGLNQQITDLKAQLAAGTKDGSLSQAEEDALGDTITALQAKVDAMDPTSPVVLPPADGGTGTPPTP